QMGAVSIVFPIVQIIVGLGMTFGSGAASYISRLLGEENVDQANRTASTALFSSLVIGVVSILISLCFLDNILVALGATKTILPYAREYALIYIAGAILNIINVTMNNIITAEGRAKLTMISML
ncbi:MAG TPA: MATE family efflux transporter, partial [Firmicutes bacterium]|nr:MATE family efflux transporter [Bacillota bacterium]